jgi:voltage-gated sodium channel
MEPIIQQCKRLVDSASFHAFIIGAIVAAGIVVGIETYPHMMERYGRLLHFLDRLILWIFFVEICLKLGAHSPRFWRYFGDPWNVFDFSIVAVCFLPLHAEFAAVLRLARVLRVLRLVTTVPRLQILVGALLKSIPSMGYVAILLLLHFYIYAVLGTFLFGRNDPVHFGELPRSMLTLFQVVTLEGWVEVLNVQMLGSANFGYEGREHLILESKAAPAAAVAYFVSFILLGTMIILNLLIGVIMNSIQEMHAEAELAKRLQHKKEIGHLTVNDEIGLLEGQIDAMKERLVLLRHRIALDLEPKPQTAPVTTAIPAAQKPVSTT